MSLIRSDDDYYNSPVPRMEPAAIHSEVLAPCQMVEGQSAHSLAANALIETFKIAPQVAQTAVDLVLSTVRGADKTKKKIVGCGKRAMGEKRAAQLNDDLTKIMQGRGR